MIKNIKWKSIEIDGPPMDSHLLLINIEFKGAGTECIYDETYTGYYVGGKFYVNGFVNNIDGFMSTYIEPREFLDITYFYLNGDDKI